MYKCLDLSIVSDVVFSTFSLSKCILAELLKWL